MAVQYNKLWKRLIEQPALFLTSSSAALLLTGHISGCVYYNTAMSQDTERQ